MSGHARVDATLEVGGVPLGRALQALRTHEPHARAFWIYDLDALAARARRLRAAFDPVPALAAYAMKANALSAILEVLATEGLGADAVSLGELELAREAGFGPALRVLNGNGRTPEEAAWAALEGVHSVNADSVSELDVLEREAARAGRRLRTSLRVNPGVVTPGHRSIATGDDEAKFGMDPADALEAWSHRARWPHLTLDGVHVHVGSQMLDPAPLERAVDAALALARESASRGAALAFVNAGGGLGVDYEGSGREFPLERWAAFLQGRGAGAGTGGAPIPWVIEPGRWLVAPIGLLVAEVLAIKTRGGRRFVTIAAGMNDLLRPALYSARHRIEPVRPRAGSPVRVTLVGPICESADVFAEDLEIAPLEPGDLVAIRDVGAYGASMSSNYNGRGRLAELVVRGGDLIRARAGETAADEGRRRRDDRLEF